MREANYNNLRLIRSVRRISAKTLSARTGYSQAYISRLECGHRRLNTQVMYKLACALDCSMSALVERDVSRALKDVQGTQVTYGQRQIPNYADSTVRVVRRWSP